MNNVNHLSDLAALRDINKYSIIQCFAEPMNRNIEKYFKF
jgi:hypothetical protein